MTEEPKPVAWLYEDKRDARFRSVQFDCHDTIDSDNWTRTPLYTSPPSGTPAGWNDAIEAAAKVCEAHVEEVNSAPDYEPRGYLRADTADELAARIRALVKP